MKAYTYANNVQTTIAATAGSGATSITVAEVSAPRNNPPTPLDASRPGVITLADQLANPSKVEVITYTGVTNNGNGTLTLTGVTRAVDGTTAHSWAIGQFAYQAQPRAAVQFAAHTQAEDELTPSANTLSYFTGVATKALTALTAFGRSLIGAADAGAARTALGAAADAEVVKTTGSQNVAGNKILTGITTLRNGAAGGGLIVGADVGASTTTDNARKLFQISQINYDNEGLPYCVLRSESNSTSASTALDLGGTGTAAAHGFPNVRFWTAPDIDQPAVLRWFFNAAGGFQPGASGSYDIGGPTARVRDFYGVSVDLTGNVATGGVFVGNGSGGAVLRVSTANGADSQTAVVSASGAVTNTRGAYVRFNGNQQVDRPGWVEIFAGNVAGNRIDLNTSGALRVRIDSSGNVAFGGVTSPTCSIDTNGFTKLGESSPKLKTKEITGTTAAVAFDANFAHGLDRTKIVGHMAQVLTDTNELEAPGYGDPVTGVRFYSVSIGSTNVRVSTGASATAVASRPFNVLIFYKE